MSDETASASAIEPSHGESTVETDSQNIIEVSQKAFGCENGTLFVYDDESTYPPEFTFVVINLQPGVPVYYDRKANTWWTAIADKNADDIYARDGFYGSHEHEEDIYWQLIEFQKSDVLFIPTSRT